MEKYAKEKSGRKDVQMNKSSLIQKLVEETELPQKEVEAVLNSFLQCVESCLKQGEKVQLMGFGTFDVRRTEPRPGRNPRHPEVEITIPASNVPYFRPGKMLRDALNPK